MLTDDEKRELIAEARETQEEVTRSFTLKYGEDTGNHLLSRLADALEGTLTEDEWEYSIVGHGYVTTDRYELDAPTTALRRRRRTGKWEVVPNV